MKRNLKTIRILFIAAIWVVSLLFSQDGKLVPIKLELPKPMFIGTPQNLNVKNLQKPLGKPRPAFLAPAGTENVALGKTVYSSDDYPVIGEVEMITDGDKNAAEGSFVELGPFLQDVTVDLGENYKMYAIVLWHFHKQARVYFDVVIQTADDKDMTENVTTLFNNDIDNSAGFGVGKDMHYVETSEGKLIDAKGVMGRFVKFYSKGNTNNDLNHYIEVAVYGLPVK
ncbi:MAG: hypothetical protein HOB40_09270 [Candidatus Marinimicrobia bacterium]|jgi:hypothetical protein|nr:hypothetical protein [Candidatus Neomarinimicrobiota bacterium]MBT3501557.1 hypothetical protein [Candidatus Neomarinimicrobiota bacterium]MBT3838710.1 hypothetical protein [Candidatus Neomarinimicrobiota bacterium]MBT3998389.1 hypothetical protein [Candidatus Neomarinimicrobiota bacterium]MBT4282424.1 hypothetical protein [Candidatus Neomarinimicrobiota bacterium]